MGLFYNPQPPHIGSAQPLESKKILPTSGPAPQNPPFVGSRVRQEVLLSWAAVAVAAAILPRLLVPQPAAAAAFPFKGAFAQQEVMASWSGTQTTIMLPALFVPSAPAATPQNPPVIGSKVPTEVLNAWIPPAPQPPVGARLTPPSAPQNPPFAGGAKIPGAVQIGWIPPPPQPPVGARLTPPISAPQNPPFAGGAAISVPVQLAWLPAAPQPIVGQKRTPATGVVPSQSPYGSKVSQEILVAWGASSSTIVLPALFVPSAPAPTASTPPPISGYVISYLPDDPLPFLPRRGIPVSGPAAQLPAALITGSRIPVAVQVAWLPPAPQPPVTSPLTPPISAPSLPPFVGGFAISYLPHEDLPILPRLGIPVSGPAPQNRPLVGAAVSLAVLDSWYAEPAPRQPRGPVLTPSGPVAQNPPLIGARIAYAILNSWAAVATQAIVANSGVPLNQTFLTVNPEYVVGYSRAPKRSLGYPGVPVRKIPTIVS